LYYQLANVFVLLTHPDESAEEGWGTVFLEAAASGLPVVAGRAGGVEEAVEHLVNGLVVDVYQVPSVVASIVELLKNPDYAGKMGSAGKARVKAEFVWSKQLAKILNDE
jgi:phosphatidylinositol alpha-1,6-mannosyltransferase